MDIELYSKLQNPIDAIDRIGEFFARSGLFGCERTEQGKVLAMACLIEKKSPIQVAREYHLIEGKLSDRADALLAKFLAAGGKRSNLIQTPEKSSITLTSRDGITMTFTETWDEIQKEPFVFMKDGKSLKKNWATPRARMQTLWARCISQGVRTLSPDISCGIKTPEEIEDEASDTPAKAIVLASEPPKVEKPANVVDLQPTTTKTEEQELAAAGLAPVVKEEKPAEFQSGPNYAATGRGDLSEDLCQQIEAIIGQHGPAAFKWFHAQTPPWVPTDKFCVSFLAEARARRIIKQPDKFIAAINK